MRLAHLQIRSFPAPFRLAFRHDDACRTEAGNVIVAATSACGLVGYGEGCPRSHLSGETPSSAGSFLDAHSQSIVETVDSFEGLCRWVIGHHEEIDTNPAAFCAIELALLDLLGKVDERAVESLLELPPLRGRYRYTAVLGTGSGLSFQTRMRRYRRAGFREFKIRLSGDLEVDRARIGALRRRDHGDLRLRADADNLWSDADAAIAYLDALDVPFFAVEEPLEPGDLAGCRRIAEARECPIILDESLLHLGRLDELSDVGRWIVNVRVSMLGGLLRTLAMEAAFGTYLLSRDLSVPVLMFGADGTLDATRALAAGAPGLGLAVDAEALHGPPPLPFVQPVAAPVQAS